MAVLRTYTDRQLASLLATGSEVGVFDEIYRRHWKTLYSEAYKRLHDGPLCEEVVQDVFTDLWVHRADRRVDNLPAYLLTAVRYQVFMRYKKVVALPAFEEPLEHMAVSSDGADTALFVKEFRAFIDRWLETQPEKRREIFRMRYLEEKTTREIAGELGLSQKTVQNTLNTAVKDLKGTADKHFLWMAMLHVLLSH